MPSLCFDLHCCSERERESCHMLRCPRFAFICIALQRERERELSHVTVSSLRCDLQCCSERDSCHMLRCPRYALRCIGLHRARELSHVTVSSLCFESHCVAERKLSHVTVSSLCFDAHCFAKRKSCHMLRCPRVALIGIAVQRGRERERAVTCYGVFAVLRFALLCTERERESCDMLRL